MVPATGLLASPPRRIAVFRALVLGDLLCATPALRALKAAWPRAQLTLIGLPWAQELAARLPSVDRFERFPGFPGLPEIAPDLRALPGFLQRMQARGFDLAVQLHGSGGIVNPLLATFGARHVAGFHEPGGWSAEPALHAPWPTHGHETLRLLRLVDHLGLPRQGTRLDFPLRPDDRDRLLRSVPELRDDACAAGAAAAAPIVCVHAGAQLPSRRWPIERFAAVADALAGLGLRVVLTGTAAEAAQVAALRAGMRSAALDLSGRTDLFALGALVERAALVLCNDTGISHVAAALGTPSVVISSGADVARWAPLDERRHTVLWHDTACRPCAFRDCPYQHECALGVSVAAVLGAARERLDAPVHASRLQAPV